MVEKILTAAGVPHWPVRCPDPPAGKYALYFDDVTTDGPDGHPWILQHDAMVELYTPVQDPEAEAALEAAIAAEGLQYTKQARYWLQSIKRYQVIYEFTFYEKRRA